jgi:hypothetical protein
MTNHEQTERSTDAFPNRHLLASMFSASAPIGLWFQPADLRGWHVLLAVIVASIALLPFARWAWLFRARSRRWRAALDAYALREIARDRHGEVTPS